MVSAVVIWWVPEPPVRILRVRTRRLLRITTVIFGVRVRGSCLMFRRITLTLFVVMRLCRGRIRSMGLLLILFMM